MSYSFALIVSYLEASFLSLRPVEVTYWGIIFFLSLYFFFASAVWLLARLVNQPIETKPTKAGQTVTEVLDSIRSILIFGIGVILPWAMIKLNIASFPKSISTISILTEMLLLIIWNDIHFYVVHRLLHSQFKKSHSTHHSSVAATPFTAYSMSILEALLLGSVMPIAMLFHSFSFVSLAFLPIWSISINVLAHSNCNLFPSASEHSPLGLIKHHQNHHSWYHGNYSFFFTQLDSLFKTTQSKMIKGRS